MLRAVAERDGYVGIVAMPMILTPSGRGATIDHVVDHLLHAIDVVGPDHVGVGTDWGKPYYQAMDWGYGSIRESLRAGGFDWVGWLPEHHFYPEEVCRGVETWDKWPRLIERMLERGIPAASVDNIAGGNFLRFWRAAQSPTG